jgi:predicted nucleotidyltransferase
MRPDGDHRRSGDIVTAVTAPPQPTQPDPNEAAKTAATQFARRLAGIWQATLGTELLGAYLMGSLAHGGFSRRYSDIDLALVTADGLTTEALDRLRGEASALSAEWGSKVSVFWTDRQFSHGRFPPLDRVDYLDHAVALLERERVRPARPTIGEIRDYLRGAPFTNWAKRARDFAATTVVEPKDHKAYLRALLYPGRLCYSWITGRIGSNEDAVVFLRERRVPTLDVELIERALRCRQAAADPDELFGARSALPSQVEVCAALLAC